MDERLKVKTKKHANDHTHSIPLKSMHRYAPSVGEFTETMLCLVRHDGNDALLDACMQVLSAAEST